MRQTGSPEETPNFAPIDYRGITGRDLAQMQGRAPHQHARQGEGKGIQLEAPLRMTLERAIEYIDIDEYVEATPKSLRLRKRILDATARKRAAA